MIQTAVFVSILLSLAFSELLGLFTGGLITAGYLAFHVQQPLRMLSTLVIAALVYGLMRWLSGHMLLFGRRRYMMAMLIGLLLGWGSGYAWPALPVTGQDWRVIGYIIPGLIANDMLRQGLWRTVAVVLLATGLVRLALMLLPLL